MAQKILFTAGNQRKELPLNPAWQVPEQLTDQPQWFPVHLHTRPWL
jgi:hypothetical protein